MMKRKDAKCAKNFLITALIAVICAIFGGLCFDGGVSARAASSEDDRFAYGNSQITVTADTDKVLRVEENLTVGFIKESANLVRAVGGKMRSLTRWGNLTVKGRSYLARISDITAEVDGVPAEARTEESNGPNQHIDVRCPQEKFKKWTRENQLYYNIKLCYIWDLSDDEDGDDILYIGLFKHYYSRWFYYGGDENNTAKLTYKIILPEIPEEQTALYYGKSRTDGLKADGRELTAEVSFRTAGGYSLRAYMPSGTFDTSAEYYPYYWLFAGAVGLVIIFGAVIMFIYRGKRPLAPVEYEPPIINPLHFSAFWHGYARRRDACTLILQWAGLGCVKIKKDGKRDIIVTKLKDLPEGRTFAEYRYFSALFDGGDVYRSKDMRGMKNRYSCNRIRRASTALAEEAGSPVTRAKGTETAKCIVMFSSLVALLVSCVYFLYIAGDIMFMIFLVAVVFVFCIFARMYPLMLEMRKKRRAYKGWYNFTYLLSSLVILPPAGMLLIVISAHYMPVYDYIHIMLISVVWIFFCLYASPNIIAKRTEEAQKTYAKMLGFKKFLKSVKVAEMELMLDKNPNYYLDVLPYCMIMGLSKKLDKKTEFLSAPDWADGFDGATFASSMFGSIRSGLVTRGKKERK